MVRAVPRNACSFAQLSKSNWDTPQITSPSTRCTEVNSAGFPSVYFSMYKPLSVNSYGGWVDCVLWSVDGYVGVWPFQS